MNMWQKVPMPYMITVKDNTNGLIVIPEQHKLQMWISILDLCSFCVYSCPLFLHLGIVKALSWCLLRSFFNHTLWLVFRAKLTCVFFMLNYFSCSTYQFLLGDTVAHISLSLIRLSNRLNFVLPSLTSCSHLDSCFGYLLLVISSDGD